MSAGAQDRIRTGKRRVQEKPGGGSKFVTIPEEICDEAGIEKGDVIDFQFDGDGPIAAFLEKDGVE